MRGRRGVEYRDEVDCRDAREPERSGEECGRPGAVVAGKGAVGNGDAPGGCGDGVRVLGRVVVAQEPLVSGPRAAREKMGRQLGSSSSTPSAQPKIGCASRMECLFLDFVVGRRG